MEQSNDEITKRWQEEPDERLIKAATKDLYEYPPEIQEIIKSEVKRRKLDDVEFYTPSTPKEIKSKKEGYFEPEKKGIQKGVVGGLVMMLIAVVWFFVGLACDYIFFYPPILFVIGIYAVLKGISTGNIVGKQETTCPIGDKENPVRKYTGEIKGGKCRTCGKKIDESEMAYVVDEELLCIECEKKLSESEDKATQKEILNTSIGVETLGETFTPILERGSTLPCEKKEIFSTAEDNQQSVEIHVLQGDAKTISNPSMRNVGRFILRGIPPGRAGEPQIEVAFAMTSDGQFQLRAKDLITGHMIEVADEDTDRIN